MRLRKKQLIFFTSSILLIIMLNTGMMGVIQYNRNHDDPEYDYSLKSSLLLNETLISFNSDNKGYTLISAESPSTAEIRDYTIRRFDSFHHLIWEKNITFPERPQIIAISESISIISPFRASTVGFSNYYDVNNTFQHQQYNDSRIFYVINNRDGKIERELDLVPVIPSTSSNLTAFLCTIGDNGIIIDDLYIQPELISVTNNDSTRFSNLTLNFYNLKTNLIYRRNIYIGNDLYDVDVKFTSQSNSKIQILVSSYDLIQDDSEFRIQNHYYQLFEINLISFSIDEIQTFIMNYIEDILFIPTNPEQIFLAEIIESNNSLNITSINSNHQNSWYFESSNPHYYGGNLNNYFILNKERILLGGYNRLWI